MKRIMFILGVSIIMALLTVTAALAGWWLGASLPLDISDTTQQIAALLTASGLYMDTLYCKSQSTDKNQSQTILNI